MALSELLTFFMMVLYLALPAMVFSALISLSVIEDINTHVATQALYQGIYLAIVYLLIRVQKNAIIGQENHVYLQSIPTTKVKRHLSTLLITAIAGNLPLLTPLWLLSYITSTEQLLSHLHFLLFATTVVGIAVFCVLRKRPPVLCLLFSCCIAVLPEFTKLSPSLIVFNALLLGILIIENFLHKAWESKSWLLPMSKINGYWQMRIIYLCKTPSSVLFRLFLFVVLVALIAFVQRQVAQIALIEIQLICSYLVGLLLGSLQFEHQTFKAKYHYYLRLTQLSLSYCMRQELLMCCLTAILLAIIMITCLAFSLSLLILLPVFALITAISVVKLEKSFFIPSAFVALILIVLNL